jgi:hypothetical protein
MSTILPLDKMTIEQKLQALEELTIDLHKHESLIEPPDWHFDVLSEREQLVREGKVRYLDWDDVKKEIEKIIARDRPNESRGA